MNSGMRVVAGINEGLFLRDPVSSELGVRIIENAVALIEELGFEQFTFRKLAQKIGSTEASVYRYFENKHNLLVYLVSWYWAWLDYRIAIESKNLKLPEEVLKVVIHVLTFADENDPATILDEQLLHSIVLRESSKAYHVKEVDDENRAGFFVNYKQLCKRISEAILAFKPEFPYPKALASSLIETAHNAVYFSEHLPSLTDIPSGDRSRRKELLSFFLFGLLNSN